MTTPDRRAFLESLASSDDPVHRAAAAHGLARLAGSPLPDEPRPPSRAVVPIPSKAMLARINTCLYRECRTGCQRTKCHAGRGDPYHGTVTIYDCAKCLGGTGRDGRPDSGTSR